MFTVYETGTWELPFGSQGAGDRMRTKVGTLYVNTFYYTRRDNISTSAQVANLLIREFCQIDGTIYLRNDSDNPLWLYRMPYVGKIQGLTDERSLPLADIVYTPDIDYVPAVSDSADNLQYGAMQFKSETLTLRNNAGRYDAMLEYFGSKLRVQWLDGATIHPLYEYYVKNVEIGLAEVKLTCGDPREKLRQKVPGRVFTREAFPKIREEVLGEPMRDAYGKCEWLPCVCVDELDIYEEDGVTPKQYRTFYAARVINNLSLLDTRPGQNGKQENNSVWVKMTQTLDNAVSEVWTPQAIETAGSDFAHGFFRLPIARCIPATWLTDNVPEVYEVCACGYFGGSTTPYDIIRELLWHYCGTPKTDDYYTPEMQTELAALKPVGIVYADDVSVFEAIEQLQDASDFGFRFMPQFTKWSARRDANTRPVTATIKWWEIVDIGAVLLDMNIDTYTTIVQVPFARNWHKDTADVYSGDTNRAALLETHGVDSVYDANSYLTNKSDAQAKAAHLEAFFKKNRISIRGLAVLHHPWLRVYDIVTVDLRLPTLGRTFGGTLTCKVMGVHLDLRTLVNTLDLIECAA
jgi:hypothetical protein